MIPLHVLACLTTLISYLIIMKPAAQKLFIVIIQVLKGAVQARAKGVIHFMQGRNAS
jgi:hypothetical protein